MDRRIATTAALLTACIALVGCTPQDGQSGGFLGTNTTTATTVAAKITLPTVAGQNAKIVMDKLRKLGLKRAEFGSVDPSAKVVLAPANWTVVSIEPAAGTQVGPDDDVILKVTKHP